MNIITITVDPQGNTTIEAHGHAGRSCLKATESLERALGKVQQRHFKPEFYRGQAAVTQQQPLGANPDQP